MSDRRNCCHVFGSDSNAALSQSRANLFSTISLQTIVKDLLYQPHKLKLRFLSLAVVSTTEDRALSLNQVTCTLSPAPHIAARAIFQFCLQDSAS